MNRTANLVENARNASPKKDIIEDKSKELKEWQNWTKSEFEDIVKEFEEDDLSPKKDSNEGWSNKEETKSKECPRTLGNNDDLGPKKDNSEWAKVTDDEDMDRKEDDLNNIIHSLGVVKLSGMGWTIMCL